MEALKNEGDLFESLMLLADWLATDDLSLVPPGEREVDQNSKNIDIFFNEPDGTYKPPT